MYDSRSVLVVSLVIMISQSLEAKPQIDPGNLSDADFLDIISGGKQKEAQTQPDVDNLSDSEFIDALTGGKQKEAQTQPDVDNLSDSEFIDALTGECPVDYRLHGSCDPIGERNPPNRCYRNSDCSNGLLCCYDACLAQTCKNPVAAGAPGASANPAPGASANPAPGASANPAPGASANPAPSNDATAQGCQAGFFVSQGSNNCYKYFNDEQRNWQEAKAKCQEEGLVLASPFGATIVQLRDDLLSKYGDANIWLNARGDGSAVIWEQGNPSLRSDSPLFYPGGNRGVTTRHCLGLASWNWAVKSHPGKPYHTWACAEKSRSTLCEVQSQGFDERIKVPK